MAQDQELNLGESLHDTDENEEKVYTTNNYLLCVIFKNESSHPSS